MTLSMAHCIGRAECTSKPDAARGLCRACYALHRGRGTLHNFPTMAERTAELRAAGAYIPRVSFSQSEYTTRWRHARQAERVLIEGKLVHPSAPMHGRLHSYLSYGCKGPMCSAAYKHYRATGETKLPHVSYLRPLTVDDCLDYKAGTLA